MQAFSDANDLHVCIKLLYISGLFVIFHIIIYILFSALKTYSNMHYMIEVSGHL